MDPSREGRESSTSRATGKDLPIEDARDPDRGPIACDAFDKAVFGSDCKNGLRRNRRSSSKAQQADQRSVPAISF